MVSISGVLQDGSSYEYTLHGPSAAASADPRDDESSSSDDLIGLREVLPLPPASDSIRPEDSKPPPQRFVNLVGGGWVHELDPATRRPLIEYLD